MGYEVSMVEDGRVTFDGDEEAICRTNIFLRTAERVLIQVGRFKAVTYDELFEGIKALPWEEFIPKDGKFWVTKASSIKSQLFSPSDIQRIAKKAMVERLKQKYSVSWFDEDGPEYPVRIFIFKDEVIVNFHLRRLFQKRWRRHLLCLHHGRKIEYLLTHFAEVEQFLLKRHLWQQILHLA